MTRPVLVTGAQGFIGRYVVRALLDAGWECVVGIGRSPMLSDAFTHDVVIDGALRPAPLTPELLRAAADGRYRYRQADVTDVSAIAALVEEVAPQTVVHVAATRRESSPAALVEGNVDGTVSLVSACCASGNRVQRFVVASSGGVYGAPEQLPLHELAPCVPVDAYAASKLAGEHIGRVLCDAGGIEFAVGRIFNVIGPGQDERHVCGRLASQVASIVSGRQAPVVSVHGLSATRDFVDVRDVASALSLLAGDGHPGGTYNIGSGRETSIRSLLARLIRHANVDGVAVNDVAGSGGVARHVASVDKLDALGPWRRFDLDRSVADILQYYVVREIDATRPGHATGGLAVR
jgi:nucleoside-diphosphate-sugar epimerase